MSELDDLDEILLTPTRRPGDGRIRNGRKMFWNAHANRLKRGFNAAKGRKRPVTLAGPPIKKSL